MSLSAVFAAGLVFLQSSIPVIEPPPPQITAPASEPVEPTTVAPAEVRGVRKICVRTGSRAQVGSRIRDPAARTICKTRDEWITDIEDRRAMGERVFADTPNPGDAIGGPTGGQPFDCRGAGVC